VPDALTRVPKLLLVEDTESLANLYSLSLAALPAEVRLAAGVDDALAAMAGSRPDLVLLDLRLPDGHGLSVLRMLRRNEPDLPVMAMTSGASVEIAVQAMRLGAMDFLVKPMRPQHLQEAVRHALQRAGLCRGFAQAAGAASLDFCGMLGASPTMQALFQAIAEAASNEAPLHIMGEAGTGKRLAASALHQLSPQRDKAFIAVDLLSIAPAQQIEAVFGEAGAVRAAAGGTLFLAQLQAASPALLRALLGWLETGTHHPVRGQRRLLPAARLVTSGDADTQRRLRPELFHRLAELRLYMPLLPERGGDILDLAAHFLRRFSVQQGKRFTHLSTATQTALMARAWTGHVRELRNLIRSAVLLSDGPALEAAMLAPEAVGPVLARIPSIRPLAETEREAIAMALRLSGGDRALAARHLGISPGAMARRLRRAQGWPSAAL
jgi:two-component system repressor protein LuxO